MGEPLKEYLLEGVFEEDYLLAPRVSKYTNNGTLYILLTGEDDEPFCDLTVNLPNDQISDKSKPNLAFVDTNNNQWLPKFIERYSLGKPTGFYGFSGYCVYPEYEFDLSKLNEGLPEY